MRQPLTHSGVVTATIATTAPVVPGKTNADARKDHLRAVAAPVATEVLAGARPAPDVAVRDPQQHLDDDTASSSSSRSGGNLVVAGRGTATERSTHPTSAAQQLRCAPGAQRQPAAACDAGVLRCVDQASHPAAGAARPGADPSMAHYRQRSTGGLAAAMSRAAGEPVCEIEPADGPAEQEAGRSLGNASPMCTPTSHADGQALASFVEGRHATELSSGGDTLTSSSGSGPFGTRQEQQQQHLPPRHHSVAMPPVERELSLAAWHAAQADATAAGAAGSKRRTLWQKMYKLGAGRSRASSEAGSSFPPTPRQADGLDNGFGSLPLDGLGGQGLAAQLAAAEHSMLASHGELMSSHGEDPAPARAKSLTDRLRLALRRDSRRQDSGLAASTSAQVSSSSRQHPSLDAETSALALPGTVAAALAPAAGASLPPAQHSCINSDAPPGLQASSSGRGSNQGGQSPLSTMNTDHSSTLQPGFAAPPLPGLLQLPAVAPGSASSPGLAHANSGGFATLEAPPLTPDGSAPLGSSLLGSSHSSSKAWQTQYLMSCAPEDGGVAPLRSGLGGRWRKNLDTSDTGAVFEELLDMPKLQRLARQRTNALEIRESDTELELLWRIKLNGGREICKSEVYPKDGAIAEVNRRDGRAGKQRGFVACREGTVHIRSVQADPNAALFHDRLRLSTRGNRLKIEHKLQLLLHGVAPVRYVTIWNRLPDEGSVSGSPCPSPAGGPGSTFGGSSVGGSTHSAAVVPPAYGTGGGLA